MNIRSLALEWVRPDHDHKIHLPLGLRLIEPRLFSTGPGIFSPVNIKTLDKARDVVRRYADHYSTQTIKQYPVGDRKVRQWVIMKNGRLYNGNTLDEMWPRVKPLPTQWWWREDPPAPKAPHTQ